MTLNKQFLKLKYLKLNFVLIFFCDLFLKEIYIILYKKTKEYLFFEFKSFIFLTNNFNNTTKDTRSKILKNISIIF